MSNLAALAPGTVLVDTYRIERVLGAGGFGITYLAEEIALCRKVTIKEYFPVDFASRRVDADNVGEAGPRSESCREDFQWGLDRFIKEAQALARFSHPNIVRVYYYFLHNNTGYMVLHFEEGQSFKAWLKSLGRAPRQKELDALLTPLLSALECIHAADFLHRDIAPDNIIVRNNGEPVLIDFGSARGEIRAHSRTVSALVKPGYSPYEQYAERSSRQGPWTDIYALGATIYHAVTGKRPPDAPTRMVHDDIVPVRDAALSSYRPGFLRAIDKALALAIEDRPQSVMAWRGDLFAPEPAKPGWLSRALDRKAAQSADPPPAARSPVQPPPPDAPAEQGALLDYVESLQKDADPQAGAAPPISAKVAAAADRKAASTPPEPDVAAEAKGSGGRASGGRASGGKSSSPKESAGKGRDKRPAEPPITPPRAEATPAQAEKARAPARPARKPAGPILRPLVFKLAIGAAVAAVAVALQDQLPRIETRGANVPSSQSMTAATAPTARPSPVVTTATPSAAPSAETTPLAQLKGHSGNVAALAFTEDGRLLVSVASDGLRIWNATTGAPLRTLDVAASAPTSLSLAGNRAITGHADGNVLLWDLDKGERLASFRRSDASISSVAFAGGPDRFTTAAEDAKLALWEAASPATPRHVLEARGGPVHALAPAPNGTQVASAADKSLQLWDLDALNESRSYKELKDIGSALAFSPSGRYLAAASLDGTIRLQTVRSAGSFRTLTGHNGRVNALAFSPAGGLLASAADDGLVRLWSVRRARVHRTFPGHVGPVRSVAFSPDGSRLASAGKDGVIRLWRTQRDSD